MRWSSTHGGLASGSPGSLTSRFEWLVSLQGASDSMAHFSPEGVVVISGSGIAVRALLLATSLTLTMVIPLAPGRFCPSLPFPDGSLSLRCLFCSARFSRSPGLLRYSCDALGCGGPVQLSPFQGCLSGSSELGWGSVELLRTPDGRVFCLIARLVLASASPWRFGYSMFGFSVALLPGVGGVSFAFVMVVTLCSGTSLAPRLAGFTVPARSTRDKSQWENVISCGGGQVFLVRLGRHIIGGACRSYCHRL